MDELEGHLLGKLPSLISDKEASAEMAGINERLRKGEHVEGMSDRLFDCLMEVSGAKNHRQFGARELQTVDEHSTMIAKATAVHRVIGAGVRPTEVQRVKLIRRYGELVKEYYNVNRMREDNPDFEERPGAGMARIEAMRECMRTFGRLSGHMGDEEIETVLAMLGSSDKLGFLLQWEREVEPKSERAAMIAKTALSSILKDRETSRETRVAAHQLSERIFGGQKKKPFAGYVKVMLPPRKPTAI